MAGPAFKNDWYIEKGATFERSYIYYETDETGPVIDLTGYTARAQIRKSVASDEVIVELTTENGGITIDGVNGKVTVRIEADVTEQITQLEGVFDIELINGSEVERFVEGDVEFSPEVTRT